MNFPQLHFCPLQLCKSLVSRDSLQLPPLQLSNFNILILLSLCPLPPSIKSICPSFPKLSQFSHLLQKLSLPQLEAIFWWCLLECKECWKLTGQHTLRDGTQHNTKSTHLQSTNLHCLDFWLNCASLEQTWDVLKHYNYLPNLILSFEHFGTLALTICWLN